MHTEIIPSQLDLLRHRVVRAVTSSAHIALLLFVTLFALTKPAVAQTKLHHYTVNAGVLGITVLRSDGDFNGDRVNDVLATARDDWRGWGIFAFSGVDGKELWRVTKQQTLRPISATLGDVNGDGTPDAIVGLGESFGSAIWTTVYVVSGRTGQVLAQQDGYSEQDGFGSSVAALDLGGGWVGRRLIITSEAQYSLEYTTKVAIYSYYEGELWEECELDTGVVRANVGGLVRFADLTGDGVSEVVFSIASVRRGNITTPSAVFVMDGDSCNELARVDGPAGDQEFGSYLTALPDLDRDGFPDVGIGGRGFLQLHSGADLAYLGTSIRPRSSAVEAQYFRPLGDMNGDGIIEFGAIGFDSARSEGQRVLIFSGADSTIIGSLPISKFISDESRRGNDREYADFLSAQTVDRNNDGTSDFVLYVRPYQSYGLDESSLADVTTVSGTCPREAQINFVDLSDQYLVKAGVRPVSVKVTACGVDLAGTISLRVGDTTYAMYDNGKYGDELEGDRVYTAIASIPQGESVVQVKADVTNSMPLRVEKTITVQGVYNYSVISKDFAWIDHWTHDRLQFNFTSSPPKIRLPFSFSFYGMPFTEMVVNGRGLIFPQYPDRSGGSIFLNSNEPLPTPPYQLPLIATAWGLTFYSEKTSIYTKTIGTRGARKFILTFEYLEGWRALTDGEKTRLDYQVIFHEDTGRITVNYKRIESDDPFNAHGLRNTLGIQGSPLVGLTFSHNAAVVSRPLTIEYIPGSSDGDGNGDNGGGNGGGSGGGGNGGGSNGGGSNNNGGAPGSSLENAAFNLFFSFAQQKRGAQMRFDIQSNSLTAKQGLTDCTFSVLAGQGTQAATATYRPLGSVVASEGSRVLDLKRFTQPLQPPKKRVSKKRGSAQKLFIRAGAVCSSGRVSLLSPPIQVRTSKAKAALPATRWMQRLGANLRLQ